MQFDEHRYLIGRVFRVFFSSRVYVAGIETRIRILMLCCFRVVEGDERSLALAVSAFAFNIGGKI